MRWIILLSALLIVLRVSAKEFPENSVFHASIPLTDQDAKPFLLKQQKNKVQLVAFVYSHCTSICPVIVADLLRLDTLLSAEIKPQVEYVLVSLNPEKDTPELMKTFLRERGITDRRWHFVRASNDDTRELALLFDVRYNQTPKEIIHSNVISVLGPTGLLVFQRKGNSALETLVETINATLNTPNTTLNTPL
jgi:protein SCO1